MSTGVISARNRHYKPVSELKIQLCCSFGIVEDECANSGPTRMEPLVTNIDTGRHSGPLPVPFLESLKNVGMILCLLL